MKTFILGLLVLITLKVNAGQLGDIIGVEKEKIETSFAEGRLADAESRCREMAKATKTQPNFQNDYAYSLECIARVYEAKQESPQEAKRLRAKAERIRAQVKANIAQQSAPADAASDGPLR